MTPRFTRTRKLAQPAAMLGVDIVFTILWLSAFATQASYNSADLCGTVCGISKGIVGLGVFITYVPKHPRPDQKTNNPAGFCFVDPASFLRTP